MAIMLYPSAIYAEESLIDVARDKGLEISDEYAPKASIVTEISTGQILWAENITLQWTPASMSKVMTILLAYEAMDEGLFTLDTEVEVDDRYYEIGSKYQLSNNDVMLGCRYTVSELIDLIALPSSAAATYMLFELIEPDIDKFVEKMNKRAQELGMVNTQYVNPIGVPNELLEEFAPTSSAPEQDNLTSCQDYAVLCSYLITRYPEVLSHTSQASKVIQQGTEYEEVLSTHNRSLPGSDAPFNGVDGLKTGSTGTGYNHTITCEQDGMRVVEVIMGVATWGVENAELNRHLIGNALLEDAFANYEYRIILEAGKYKVGRKTVLLEDDLYDCVPKDWEEEFIWDLENGTVTADLQREYISGYSAPKGNIEVLFPIVPVLIGIVAILVILILTFIIYKKRQRRRQMRISRSSRRYRR